MNLISPIVLELLKRKILNQFITELERLGSIGKTEHRQLIAKDIQDTTDIIFYNK